jgi:hypothetical protein
LSSLHWDISTPVSFTSSGKFPSQINRCINRPKLIWTFLIYIWCKWTFAFHCFFQICQFMTLYSSVMTAWLHSLGTLETDERVCVPSFIHVCNMQKLFVLTSIAAAEITARWIQQNPMQR